MLKFEDYTIQLVNGLESYMEQHISSGPDCITSWCEWGWLEDVYTPIYEAYQNITTADGVEELLMAVQWASHLNHASGHIFDYCWNQDEMHDTLDHLQQHGLDATFKWRRAAKKLLKTLEFNPDIPSPDSVKEMTWPPCYYCGIPVENDGDIKKAICEDCEEAIARVGECINCSHGIGHYGELCYDCMVEHTGRF